MPLPNMSTRRAYYFDVDLELRDYDAAAESTTASETGIAFAGRDIDLAKVVVDHAAIGGTVDGSNYWTVSVEISDVVGGTYTEVATTGALAATAATIELPLSGKLNEYKDTDSAFIRVTATETGTTAGDLTYGAYISPA
ncbi:MAG: hypothetical protein AAGJ95_11825 [Cyanobacteria bacterium J06554_11]